MSQHVSELKALLERIPRLLDDLSQDVWTSIDHDDAESLQAGVAFKQKYNDRANRLKKSANEFVALLDDHLEMDARGGDNSVNLRIKDIRTNSNLDRLEQFLTPAPASKDNR